MTRKDLKVQLFAQGITQVKLAEEYGCTKTFVCQFLKGNLNSKRFESFI